MVHLHKVAFLIEGSLLSRESLHKAEVFVFVNNEGIIGNLVRKSRVPKQVVVKSSPSLACRESPHLGNGRESPTSRVPFWK